MGNDTSTSEATRLCKICFCAGSYSFGNGNTIKCKWSKGIISGECTFTRAQVQQCNEDKTAYSYTGTYKDGKIIAVGRPAVYIRSIPTGEIDLL